MNTHKQPLSYMVSSVRGVRAFEACEDVTQSGRELRSCPVGMTRSDERPRQAFRQAAEVCGGGGYGHNFALGESSGYCAVRVGHWRLMVPEPGLEPG